MSSNKHRYGKPLQILEFVKNGSDTKAVVDDNSLDKMLLHPEVKDRKIVVISIIGALRKGKSFYLSYCLRYLYANVSWTII